MKSTDKLFTCETCDKTFVKAKDLSRHMKMTTTHDLIIKNTINGTVFVCDVCRQEFKDAKYLFAHRRNVQHDRETEKVAQDAGRSVILTTTLAFVRVHDAVKSAFEQIHEEVFPLYTDIKDENPEAKNERIEQFLQPYSNFVNDGLQRDAFLVCDALIKDIQSL